MHDIGQFEAERTPNGSVAQTSLRELASDRRYGQFVLAAFLRILQQFVGPFGLAGAGQDAGTE